jgi:imidazole glycerol-phosphate synthase subunit HisH
MLAILDYNAGNLTSVELAVRHVGGDPVVTQDSGVVERAERVIFPGVGAAASCMANLRGLGLDTVLKNAIRSGKPVLAICIGIQLLFDRSEEDGGVACLGFLPGEVRRFSFSPDRHVKVPHMGWNDIHFTRPHPLFKGVEDGSEFYFVHSYCAQPRERSCVLAECEYEGETFAAAVGQGNLTALQFHPERSGRPGLAILRNFLAWDGRYPGA